MNRIQLCAPGAKAVAVDLSVPTSRHQVPHSFFAPMHYEPNYAYPLLVWLHSPGGNERELRRVVRWISMRNYVAVAPRGTLACQGVRGGFDWGDSDSMLATATQRVFDCIDLASERFHIAPQRVFLAGFESGGTTAFRVGLAHASRFAGVLSVGGPFPTDRTPLASIRQARRLPLFIAQGLDSERYPLDRTCSDLHLFHSAGLLVSLRLYPCGDELTTKMLSDIDAWIMEQVTGVPSHSEEESTPLFDPN